MEAGFQNASRCRGPGCGAVGKTMLEGYCDKCYVKEQSARLNQVAHQTTHSPPPVVVRLSSRKAFLPPGHSMEPQGVPGPAERRWAVPGPFFQKDVPS